jgi:carboxymethylenebutenolidase
VDRGAGRAINYAAAREKGDLMGTMISFPRTGGGTAQGYLAEAKDPKAPGVVVIQEWWGLQGQIKAVCDRFAGEGFTALAPDLYGGKVVPYHDPAAANAAMSALDFKATTDQAVRGAVQHLAARGGKVGLTGFCMGGAVTVIGAVHIPELAAAVSFYGIPPEGVAAPKDIRVPFQGHFANQDDWCTPAVVNDFEKKLQAAGKTFELYRYEGHHAFMNSERKDAYSGADAQVAWDRTVKFFRRHLGG